MLKIVRHVNSVNGCRMIFKMHHIVKCNMRCAFVTESDDRTTGLIGDPFQVMNGWAVHLDLDAGRHGRPNISLYFSINNGNKDGPVSRNKDQRTEFAITWRTGVATIIN